MTKRDVHSPVVKLRSGPPPMGAAIQAATSGHGDQSDEPLSAVPSTASACGKAILVGEHAVVYGAQAVAMPVPAMHIGIKLTPLSRQPGEPVTARVTLGGRSVSDHLRGVLDEAFSVLDLEPFSLEMEGSSSVLIGAGLGSSASLCVAVLRALANATGRRLSPWELASTANQLERRFHGNPSGLDTAVVAMEQAIVFRKGEAPRPTPVRPIGGEQPWHFAILDSGARSSTLTMIQVAAPYFSGLAGAARVRRFDEIAAGASAGLAAGDPLMVAEAMRAAGAELDQAGVVGAPLSDLIDIAQAEGALAAKSTGAGGGGCVLALLDPARVEAQLTRLKERLGLTRVHGVSLT